MKRRDRTMETLPKLVLIFLNALTTVSIVLTVFISHEFIICAIPGILSLIVVTLCEYFDSRKHIVKGY
jgi:hypothetical protein